MYGSLLTTLLAGNFIDIRIFLQQSKLGEFKSKIKIKKPLEKNPLNVMKLKQILLTEQTPF